MPEAVAILGGSSPFTVELIDALVDADAIPAHLTLQGRDRRGLAAVACYARTRVGNRCDVRIDHDVGAAVAGATMVVHQARYGGLAARGRDEEVAHFAGLPADETLGPGGLAAAIRTYVGTLKVASELGTRCPSAWVLNLTNPVGIAVVALQESGVPQVLGLCELPSETAAIARARVGWPENGATDWWYSGFNHRGFVYGAPWMPALMDVIGDESLAGIPGATIRRLRAIPVKYFLTVTGARCSRRVFGRANEVERVRRCALDELARCPTIRPAALKARRMPWYRGAVVPAIRAVRTGERVVATTVHADGLAWEAPVRAVDSVVVREAQPVTPGPVTRWIRRFEQHERAVLEAARDPSAASVAEALRLDPIRPQCSIASLAQRVLHAGEEGENA